MEEVYFMAKKYNLKFDDKICEQLCTYRENGLNLTDCAKLCSISPKTLRRWLKKGREAKTGKYKEFSENWDKCNAKFKAYHLNKITKDESWQSSAWILERSFPDEFAKPETRLKVNADVDNKISGDVTVNLLDRVKQKRSELNDLNSRSE